MKRETVSRLPLVATVLPQPMLRVLVQAALEVRVAVALASGDWKSDVGAVRRAAVVRANRVDLIGRALVLADEAAEVTQPLSPGERPERLFTEQQVDASIGAARIGKGW